MKLSIPIALAVLLAAVSMTPAALAEPLKSAAGRGGAEAPAKQYEVKYPTFNVVVNNAQMNNGKSRFPVLLYEGITYFPMTWRFAHALGINIEWDEVNGLAISKSGQPPAKLVNDSAILSARHFYAQLPTFPIRVNNQLIDNAQEPYPVLLFNDITYFPMTWRFAVEELGLTLKLENNKLYVATQSNISTK
jgi:hypothetical protein